MNKIKRRGRKLGLGFRLCAQFYLWTLAHFFDTSFFLQVFSPFWTWLNLDSMGMGFSPSKMHGKSPFGPDRRYSCKKGKD